MNFVTQGKHDHRLGIELNCARSSKGGQWFVPILKVMKTAHHETVYVPLFNAFKQNSISKFNYNLNFLAKPKVSTQQEKVLVMHAWNTSIPFLWSRLILKLHFCHPHSCL
jgi:hypothetical protein